MPATPLLFARPSGHGSVGCDSNRRKVGLLDRHDASAENCPGSRIFPPDDLSLAAQLETLQTRREQLKNDRMNSLGQISQSQIKTNEVAAQLASLDQALKDAPTKVAALEAELQTPSP